MRKVRPDLVAQLVVAILFTEHRILTEVAGAGLSTIKLRPPLTIGDAEAAGFVRALQRTLETIAASPGILWDFGIRLATHALAP